MRTRAVFVAVLFLAGCTGDRPVPAPTVSTSAAPAAITTSPRGETDPRGELYCNLVTTLSPPAKSVAERAPTGMFVYRDPHLGVVPLASVVLAGAYESMRPPPP